MRLGRIRGSASALLVGVALLAPIAGAQTTDDQRSGARAAATAGGQAFQDRKWADAVDMFTRAESLVHSPVHLLYLARSYDKLGQLVKARENYIKITNEDLPAGSSQPAREAKASAEKELEALEPRVPYVSVVVQGAGPKPVTVTMDGVQVPAALLGVPRPVDPGDHRFEALAEGMDSAVSQISVRESRSETVVLTLHPSTPSAVPAAAPSAAPPTYPVGYAPGVQPPPQADSDHHGPSPLTWVALGVGVVGLGVGTVFALNESSKESDANKACPPVGCSTAGATHASSLDGDARSARTVSIVGFVAGGLGLAAGVTLLVLTMPHHDAAAATATTVSPWVGLGSAGVSGRF
jgi:hypothetical protein